MLRLALTVLCLLAFLPTPTFAQDARAHFRRGQVGYDQGDYELALTEWRTAYELDAQPLIQFNIAQAAERLGRLDEAAAALDLYLSTASPADANQGNARARRAAIRERLAQTGVRLRGGPDGASITIDDADWGRIPRPDAISLEPGAHQILIQLRGFEPFRSTVVVPAGQTVEVEVVMAHVDADAASPAEELGGPESSESESSGPGATPWIIAGAGAAMVVAAGVLGGIALSKANDAPSSEGDEADSARTLGLTADILGITGAVAISTGLIWYFVGRNKSNNDASVRVSPYAGPERAGLDARWSF